MLIVIMACSFLGAWALPVGLLHFGLASAKTPETIISPRGMKTEARETPRPLSRRVYLLNT